MIESPDDISVLLMAPTGVAAYNIHGATIHSALSISTNVRLPYQPLSEEKISTLRHKLRQLQIVIIDEISMVDQKMLHYIHGRLRQVKQSRNHNPFGNVSILAVGDFYQLPPVKGKSLYQTDVTGDLWNDNFVKVELTEIMRQKEDVQFAKLLNRLRVRKKKEQLESEDVALLKSRETGEDWTDALHIYPCNKQVDEYNRQTLFVKCSECVCVLAKDFQKDAKSGKMIPAVKSVKKSSRTNLSDCLWLGVGARVMLTRNLDVSDGLVNGVFGTVSDIVMLPNEHSAKIVKVKFDNEKVGAKLKKQSSGNSTDVVCIEMVEDNVTQVFVRHQFPLKLAWACTSHKVQGMTTEKAVVCLDRTFSAGQAYVSLSRVVSLNGLIIEGFDEKFIYCNEKVAEAISEMPLYIDNEQSNDSVDKIELARSGGTYCTSIAMHNIQGLQAHFVDFKRNKEMCSCDFICLTETWSDGDFDCEMDLSDYKWYHQPRCMSYDNTSRVTHMLKEQCHGGVAVCGKKDRLFSRLNLPVHNLEYIAFQIISKVSVAIVIIYRPASYVLNEFLSILEMLLNELHNVSNKCIVMGDFNEDIMKQSSVQKVMHDHGYKQCVTEATTENGTLLDHVYVRNIDVIETYVSPTYYSYHEAVILKF
ncbi:ATP-dependent DNA helicase PIF1-like [Patiria miniata]|uniref:ATP-dependent DNA helicase n=1 Tax=Patiria miniata TaxID=46514 RepID=A0A914AHM4_PATMI|nr:ATP-dependent DNA helicase PIF1-like [Patiria miniata]